MRGNFAICFAQTERYEGLHKFSNNKHDPGGATYSGVTQRVYNAYRAGLKMPVQDVRRMSDGECQFIYERQYWDAVHGDTLPAGLDLVLYDCAVNAGPVKAIKLLQQAFNVHVDGHWGLETTAAVQNVTSRAFWIKRYCALRLGFLHRLTTWNFFGRGWSARVNGIQAAAVDMATPKTPLTAGQYQFALGQQQAKP